MKYNDIKGMTFTCITVVERRDGKWLGKCNRCGFEKTYTYNEIKNKKSNRCSNCKSVKHENYFDIINNEEKAYILGFITADGCNYGDGKVKIDLSIDDLDILIKIRDCIGVENDILTYEQPDKIFNGKAYPSKTQKRLNIWNKNICEQLIDKGCVKDKSKYLMFPNEDKVPKELYRHYVRGYFDGNGHLGYWIDNKIFLEDEIAIRFKHKLVSIHLFPNGNGRHSRLMADVLISKVFHKPVFTWGMHNKQSDDQIRALYLKSLREADNGNYTKLISFSRS
jgi:hypothetical protein